MTPRSVIAWIALLSCAVSAPAMACVMLAPERSSEYQYDDKVYVFYGEVIGYTSVNTSDCADDCAPSWGLLLKVLEPVQLPRATETVGLFGFEIDAMCSRLMVKESAVRSTPIGTRLAVAAYELADVQWPDGHGAPALEVKRWPGNALFEVPKDRSIRAVARSRYDYKTTCYRFDPTEMTPYFELQKDLVRLHRARSENEAAEILSRLTECPVGNEPLETLTSLHLKREASLRKVKRAALWSQYATSQDEATELELANGGNPFALIARGERLEQRGEIDEALIWFRRAADKGSLPAQLYIALMYKHLSADAAKYEPRAQAAFSDVLRKARNGARQGDVIARIVLAEILYDGIGGVAEDRDEAIRLWCAATEKPIPPLYPLVTNIDLLTERDRAACPKH